MGINVNDLANEFEFEGNTFIEGVFQLVNTMRSAQGDEIVIESYYITEKTQAELLLGLREYEMPKAILPYRRKYLGVR